MPGATVRVSYVAWKALREIADLTGKPMQAVLDKAIEEYRRKYFLEEANRAFATLRNDPEAWQSELEERSLWDGVLRDGLEER